MRALLFVLIDGVALSATPVLQKYRYMIYP